MLHAHDALVSVEAVEAASGEGGAILQVWQGDVDGSGGPGLETEVADSRSCFGLRGGWRW